MQAMQALLSFSVEIVSMTENSYPNPPAKRMQSTIRCLTGRFNAQRWGIGSIQSRMSVAMLIAELAYKSKAQTVCISVLFICRSYMLWHTCDNIYAFSFFKRKVPRRWDWSALKDRDKNTSSNQRYVRRVSFKAHLLSIEQPQWS